jgi:hypothetical protein
MALSGIGAGEIASSLPPDILGKLGILITILQAAGVIVIIYISFLIIQVVINWRRNRKINEISENIKLMNKNLEKFLRKKK